jgi:phosphonate transport system substrate-binding protein
MTSRADSSPGPIRIPIRGISIRAFDSPATARIRIVSFRRTFFTWGHPRSVEAVAEGLADGAAVDSYVWETLARGHPELTAQTRVLERSPEFGFPPIVAGPALSEPDRQAIRRVLLSQVQDAAGRTLLNELNLDSFGLETPDLYDDIARMAGRLTGGNGA